VARTVGLALLGLLVAAAGLSVCAVYRHITPRGPGPAASAQAPDFTLPDQSGAPTTLSALTEHGPSVLVFYRGFW
jgi:cytochrome oxidase Cu insertion factor (SCO1/SenC/PrrC family)